MSEIARATPEVLPAVRDLLRDAELPTAGVEENSRGFGCYVPEESSPVASAWSVMETLGSCALLWSARRSRGVAWAVRSLRTFL